MCEESLFGNLSVDNVCEVLVNLFFNYYNIFSTRKYIAEGIHNIFNVQCFYLNATY